MRLLFKQRLFSWFDSYDIFDEAGNSVFTVKGVLALGHCLEIYDNRGNKLGYVKEKVLSFLPKYCLYIGEQYIGEIKKEFTFLKPKFTLDFNGWRVSGDYWEWDYDVINGNSVIMHASKKIWNFTDTYEIDVVSNRDEDVLYSLMIVLAIDAAKCSSR